MQSTSNGLEMLACQLSAPVLPYEMVLYCRFCTGQNNCQSFWSQSKTWLKKMYFTWCLCWKHED